MRVRLFLFSVCLAGTLLTSSSLAQQAPDDASTSSDSGSSPRTLGLPLDGRRNFANFFGSVQGLFDTSAFANGQSGSFGIETGGGVILSHLLKGGSINLDYYGGYRWYGNTGYSSGTNQSLSLSYQKRLTKRWSVTLGESAGIFQNGTGYVGIQSTQGLQEGQVGSITSNPVAASSKFESSSVSLNYQASLRSSYYITGSLYFNRYTGGYTTFGAYGYSGGAGNSYRITRRLSIGLNYGYSEYKYQHDSGSSIVNTFSAGGTYKFNHGWSAQGRGGFSRVSSAGTINQLLSPQLFALLGTKFITGAYHTTSIVPYFFGGVTKGWAHSVLSITGGESVNSGNGLYLASRSLNFGGFYSYSRNRDSFGYGGGYARFSSVANTAGLYSSEFLGGSYTRQILKHLGANARYDFYFYDGLGGLPSRTDSRITFGLVFSSQKYPLSVF